MIAVSDAYRLENAPCPRPDVRWTPGQVVVAVTIMATALAFSFNVVSFLEVKNLTLWLGAGTLWSIQYATGNWNSRGFYALRTCWIAFAVILLSGLLVAPVTQLVLAEGLRVFGLLLFVSLAYPEVRGIVGTRRILGAVVASSVLCAGLAVLQRVGWLPGLFPAFPHYDQPMYSVFGNQGLLGGYLALGLTAALGRSQQPSNRANSRRGTFLLVIAGLLFVVLVLSQSRAGLLAALAGVLALAGCRVLSWRKVAAVTLLAVAGCLLLGLVSDGGIFAKWNETLGPADVGGSLRLWVWRSCMAMIGAQPVLGTGLGNVAVAAPPFLGEHAPVDVGELAKITTYHAHNDLLELVVETGLIGLILLIWIVSRLRIRRSVAFACISSIALFSLLYPTWSSTPHALVLLLLFAVNMPRPLGTPVRHGAMLLTGVASIVGGLVFTVWVFYPSFLLRRAEDVHLSGLPARGAYEQATEAAGATAEAHESFGIYLLEAGEYKQAAEALAVARRGLNTGKVYQLSGMAAEGLGDTGAAHAFYQECLLRWPHADNIRQRRDGLYQPSDSQ